MPPSSSVVEEEPAPPASPPTRVSQGQSREDWLRGELAELDQKIPEVEASEGWTASVNLRRQRSEHHRELWAMVETKQKREAQSPEVLELRLVETILKMAPERQARIVEALKPKPKPKKSPSPG